MPKIDLTDVTSDSAKDGLRSEALALKARAERLPDFHRPDDWTDADLAEGQAIAKAAQDLKQRHDHWREREAQLDGVKAVLGPAFSSAPADDGTERHFKGGDYAAWSQKAARAIMRQPDGSKALISGTYSLPSVLPGIQMLGAAPTSFLSLFSNAPVSTHSYSFRRQVTRTDNAAPAADGALKATSVYEFDRIEDNVEVLAHLAGPYPLRYFADESDLQAVLNGELLRGLKEALEAQVLSGTGVSPQLEGLATVSGTQVQAFDTDVLTTLRRAVGLVRSVGLDEPNGVAMHPTDVEDLDLLRDDSGGAGTGQFLVGGGPAGDGTSKLWRVPVVESLAIPVGTAWVANFNQAKVFVRENARIDTDTAGTLFYQNQVMFRCEGRFGFGVLKPDSFVEADLTAL